MIDIKKISKTLTNPDRLGYSLYFAQPKLPTEMKRQIQILIEEEYLKCTPLLTLLSDLMRKKNGINHYDQPIADTVDNKDSVPKIDSSKTNDYNNIRDILPSHARTESRQEHSKETFHCSDRNGITSEKVPHSSVPSPDDVYALTRIIASLQINGKERPVYLAKKLLYDTDVDLDILQRDMHLLQHKLFTSQSGTQMRQRTKTRRSRRGGKKNKKSKENSSTSPFHP